MKTKHFVLVLIAGLIVVTFYSCGKSNPNSYQTTGGGNTTGGYNNPPPSGGNSSTINISGMAFPASTTVAKGTTVKWYNKDGYPHTVTSDDGTSFNSGNLSAGATFSYVANTAGTFTYHCNIHSNMHGTLIVNP